MTQLKAVVGEQPAAHFTLALMTAGLFTKTAVFPLHAWLPAAHVAAPAPASALLSGLVIKASFYIVVRAWFDVMPGIVTSSAAQSVGLIGAVAVLTVR